MPKCRKKPVVIEAEQWFPGRNIKGVTMEPCDLPSHDPEWPCNEGAHPVVHTIHEGQTVRVQAGDWIIPEPDGVHFYPCKPDIFAATYEPVEDDNAT